ncbi:MAG: hypothetical protein Q8O00_05385, partial [Holophaga sp.]|nr:hypothetical protein [Holophaga sp.]
MRTLHLVSLGLLLLGTGCRWVEPLKRQKVYTAHEAGLTLIYENPQLESQARMNARLQVRVEAARDGEAGTAVKMTYTSLQGEMSALFFQKNGGISLSQDGRTPGLMILPEGFPDRVSRWESNGTITRVLGRAAADLHGLKLPESADRVGVWTESVSPKGQRQRSFLLPDIGEVETLIWRDGAWVSVNRLVSRGFTDLP